ncbi:hypothetical protein BC940DRAFT_349396 [Gongronella butleri]|nr:hypothetical protein BC940DRAFT_349396 [Gongronella butleri]
MKRSMQWQALGLRLSLVASLIPLTFADNTPVEPACGLVGQKIYCYGGGYYQVPDNNFTTLDLSTVDFSNPQFQWTTAKAGIPLEANQEQQYTTIGGNQSVMFYGGTGPQNAPYNLQYPLSTYNQSGWNAVVPTNTFTTDNASYAAEANLVDMTPTNRNQVWIIGGYYNKTIAQVSLTNPNGVSNADRLGVSPIIQVYDYLTATYLASPGTSLTFNNFSRSAHTATLSQDNQGIYVIGGWLIDVTHPNVEHYPPNASEVWRFDLPSLQWQNITAKYPPGVIEPRWHHSAVALPNSTYILLYGGYGIFGVTPIPLYSKNASQVLTIFDWQKNAYVFPNLTHNNFGPVGSEHQSAVLYKDPSSTKVYVGYFMGSSDTSLEHPLAYFLDVTNPQQLTWVGNGTATPGGSGSGLSGGQIAGIVIGAIAASAIACAAVVFFILRRNKRKQDFIVEKTDPRNNDDFMTAPVMQAHRDSYDMNSYNDMTSASGAHTQVTYSTDLDTATTLTNNVGPVKPDAGEYKRSADGRLIEKPVKPFSDESVALKPSADE